MPNYGFTVTADGNVVIEMEKIQLAVEEMGGKVQLETAKVETEFAEMGERIGETMLSIKEMLVTGLGIAALFEGFEFLKDSKKDFDDMQKSVANLHQTLLTMNGASGMSEEALKGQAEELSKIVVYSKAAIIEAHGMLATFGNVKGEQFSETMDSVSDYAAKFMGGDMVEAAKSLGIALDDPIKGVTRLHRQGVSFSDEQKKQIANYVKMGDMVAAQEIVLKEIKRESGGQAAAFALTDEGKLMQAQKNWEATKLEIGETISKIEVSLIPLGAKIANFVKEAFESAPVQFFIEHIGDLISMVLKAIEFWAIYKGVMLAVAGATKLYEIALKAVEIVQWTATFGMEGLTVATEGFSAALVSTGIGAFAVALGLLINATMSWNSELEETFEKLTHIKDITKSFDELTGAKDKINLAFQNIANLSDSQKGDLFTDITSNIKIASDNINKTLIPNIKNLKDKLKEVPEKITTYIGSQGGVSKAVIENPAYTKLAANIKSQEDILQKTRVDLYSATNQRDFLQSHGVNENKGGAYNQNGGAGKKNALSTVDMTGAKGGLGEAKIINIHIDTLQKNLGVKESKVQADNAVQLLTRGINNMSSSQGTTM